MVKWSKEEAVANFYLLKIHLLFLKLLFIKELTFWIMKVFH